MKMNKEEILQKAKIKKSNTPDEMELQVTQKANGIAMCSVLALCLILMISKMIAKQPWVDVYSICFMGIGAQNCYKGIKLHKRYNIIIWILYIILAIFAAASYIAEICGLKASVWITS